MQIGMVGLGRTGSNRVRRLLADEVRSAMRYELGGHEEKHA
jgi:6-phosphogluconate dehydrogenase (decarboxylating)